MSIRLAALPDPRPSPPQILAGFEESFELPAEQLALVKALAAPEDWGDEDAVLLRHLAVNVPLAIEQGRYVWNGQQILLRAGRLTTAGGAPLYLGLARTEGNKLALAWAGERPGTVAPLLTPDLGTWPELDPRLEVVVAIDLFRASELAGLALVVQNAAIAGAVEWSLRHGLAVRHLRGQSHGYFAPVHLTDRARAPELVAPLQVQTHRLVVRTLLDPKVAYAAARAMVERREELPAWMIGPWEPVGAEAESRAPVPGLGTVAGRASFAPSASTPAATSSPGA